MGIFKVNATSSIDHEKIAKIFPSNFIPWTYPLTSMFSIFFKLIEITVVSQGLRLS